MIRPADRHEYGELVVTRLNDPSHTEPFVCTCLRIQRADPRIRITAEMLEQIVVGPVVPQVSLTPADEPLEGWWPAWWGRMPGWGDKSPLGATLRVEGINQTVVYRITGYDAPSDLFLAEWPD